MDLSKYRNKLVGSEEERAVSPVIGVILMVAITVILAAVIAAFVLDIGSDLGGDDTPNSVWGSSQASTVEIDSSPDGNFDGQQDVITFTHNSGDSVSEDNLEVNGVDPSTEVNDFDVVLDSSSSQLTAGDTVTIVISNNDDTLDHGDPVINEGTEINLIWNDGSTSTTLNTHTVTSDITAEN